MSKMQELSNELKQLAELINIEATGLTEKLSAVDRELVDIYHYIEFNDLSASEGYKAYKDLQTCLKNRRAVKDDINLANILNNVLPVASAINKAENVNKYYQPRVREDLFPTMESKVQNKSNNIIAKTADKEIIFNSLDDAAKMLIDIKGPNFKGYKIETIKAKILRAASTNRKYDRWQWSF